MSRGAVDLFQQLAQNDFGFFQKLQAVSSIMTRDVQTLTLDHTWQQANDLFERGGFRHAPVLDDGQLVGVLSVRDLVRHRPPLLGTAGEGNDDHHALRTPVSQMITRRPYLVDEDDGPLAAIDVMLERHVGSVLVRDAKNELTGILTTTDLLKTVILFHRVCGAPDLVRFRLVDLDMSRGLPLDMIFSRGARSVRDVMSKEVPTLRETDPLGDAMETMQRHAARDLPVRDEHGRLTGLLSDLDVLRALPLPVPARPLRGEESRFREWLFATKDGSTPANRVGTVMTRSPRTVRPDALFTEAITTMMADGVSALPVVENDQLVGLLTVSDVLRVLRVVLKIGSLLEAGRGARADAA